MIGFFFKPTPTTEIYTLSLHDALPILTMRAPGLTWTRLPIFVWGVLSTSILMALAAPRSEEHTSELQSRLHLVCRLLLEKKTTSHTSKHKPCVYSARCLCSKTAASNNS